MVAVIAISPKPFFTIATSAVMSPRQLPQARTVSDKRACGRLKMNPKSLSKSTIEFEAKLIQAML